MLKHVLILMLWSLTLSCSADIANWNGKYHYGVVIGKTVGGSNMYLSHTLYINQSDRKNGCEFEIVGFQTDEQFICSLQEKDNTLKIVFKSFLDGETVNSYGNEVYKVNEIFFSLQLISKNKLITKWYSQLVAPSDKIFNHADVYFKKVK